MIITFNHIQFTELEYKVKTFDKDSTHTLKTSFEFFSVFNDGGNQKHFAVTFKLNLENKTKTFRLKLTAVAHFSTQEVIDDDFKNSSFINVNAPAIAFPYIRTFVSNLTLNSGYDPVVLPSFNFVRLAEENKKNNEN